ERDACYAGGLQLDCHAPAHAALWPVERGQRRRHFGAREHFCSRRGRRRRRARRRRFTWHVHDDRVGGVRDRRALACGRRGGGGGGVAVGARRLVRRAQHVVAGVGGRGARRERAVGGARDRARVAVAVVEAGVAQRRVAGVLVDDLVVHHLADFAGQGRGREAAVRARDFLQLLDREGGLRRDFDFDRRRFVGDRRFTGRRRG